MSAHLWLDLGLVKYGPWVFWVFASNELLWRVQVRRILSPLPRRVRRYARQRAASYLRLGRFVAELFLRLQLPTSPSSSASRPARKAGRDLSALSSLMIKLLDDRLDTVAAEPDEKRRYINRVFDSIWQPALLEGDAGLSEQDDVFLVAELLRHLIESDVPKALRPGLRAAMRTLFDQAIAEVESAATAPSASGKDPVCSACALWYSAVVESVTARRFVEMRLMLGQLFRAFLAVDDLVDVLEDRRQGKKTWHTQQLANQTIALTTALSLLTGTFRFMRMCFDEGLLRIKSADARAVYATAVAGVYLLGGTQSVVFMIRDVVYPAGLALLKISVPGFWIIYATPFVFSYLSGVVFHPLDFVLGLIAVSGCVAFVAIVNEYSDRVEDGINQPSRVALAERLGYGTMRRIIVFAVFACAVGLATIAALYSTTIALLGVAAVSVGLLYSLGLRFKRRGFAAQLAIPIGVVFPFMGGWLLSGGQLADLSPVAVVLYYFYFAFSNIKNLPDTRGDAVIGLRSVFSHGKALVDFLFLSPYLLVALLVATEVLAGRFLWILATAPGALLVLVFVRRARSFQEKNCAYQAGFIYAHFFITVLLVIYYPAWTSVLAAAVLLAARIAVTGFKLDRRLVDPTVSVSRTLGRLLLAHPFAG